METNPKILIRQDIGQGVPSKPSFLDSFMRLIETIPIPYWLTYLILFILQGSLSLVLAWADGWVPAGKFNSIPLIFPL